MQTADGQDFRSFVRERCRRLLEHLAAALAAPARIRDPGGQVILASPEQGADETRHSGSGVGAPIPGGDTPLGRLEVITSDDRTEPLISALAVDIGHRFSAAADLRSRHHHLEQYEAEINLLCRLTRILAPEDDFASAAQKLMHETVALLGQRALILFQPPATPLHCSAAHGLGHGFTSRLTGNEEALSTAFAGFADGAENTGQPGKGSHTGVLATPQGVFPFVAMPVEVHANPIGMLVLLRSRDEKAFTTGELRVLECLASELSNTATTRKLNRELRDMLFNTVRSLVAAVDAKDGYACGHSERVLHLSLKIAEQLGLPTDDVQTLTWAALLHDIGKIALSSERPGTRGQPGSGDNDAVRAHPERGCEVLEPIPQLRHVLPIIRYHHERFDGGGYPEGLGGEAIPFLARIIAAADAYDVIISARGHGRPRTSAEALGEIREAAGAAFDPQVVAALEALAAVGALHSPDLDPGAQSAA